MHWTGTQTGLTHDELQAALQGAADAWSEAGPCGFGITVVEDPEAHEWFLAGGVAVLFGDPFGVLGEGVIWENISGEGSGATVTTNGATFEEAPAVEMVVSDSELWVTDADIDARECAGRSRSRAC